ncbi:recombinase family protein [Streptomyces pinistramenti]|uniref:recombinase family protein n=1 Tax=Streptomyces pinistramenti TaxID=2884812 RepID=UPI001D06FF3E|nr:recombinase family protein [Streptomyces pinistramenti]MCB5911976.1 recombinase family protein [Streptomyces pinistramenti]
MITEKSSRVPAVLYICATTDRSSTVGADRAAGEGREFALDKGLRIVDTVTDLYGEPVPSKRPGWVRVREMAERGEIGVVIVRWPTALSPVRAMRDPELEHLGRHGVQVLYTWAPLASPIVGGASR